jgi:hypothetical protein
MCWIDLEKSFSFACPKEKVPKEKDSLGFRRPTYGSIPKPVKPFVQEL